MTSPWQLGASFGAFDADVRIDDEDFALTQQAVGAALAHRFTDATNVRLSLGAVLGGDLVPESSSRLRGRRWSVEPGWLASVTLAHRWFGGPDRPFLVSTVAFGLSFAATEEVGVSGSRESLSASDLRVGALFGTTFLRSWSPYLAARVFAGPIGWRVDGRDVSGFDRRKYALGVGSSLLAGEGVTLAVDAAMLGEQSVSAGATFDL